MKQISLYIATLMLCTKTGAALAENAHHAALDAHAQAGHDAAASGGVGLPQFDPSSFAGQVFWLIIAFSVLYFFFAKKTLPEISSVMENRKMHIQSDLDSAETLKTEAEQVHAAYDEALDKARQKSSGYFLKATEKINKNTVAQLQAFQDKASEQISALEAEINDAKTAAMDDMNVIAAEIASEAAEKIIGVSADIKKAKTVVQSIQKKKAA